MPHNLVPPQQNPHEVRGILWCEGVPAGLKREGLVSDVDLSITLNRVLGRQSSERRHSLLTCGGMLSTATALAVLFLGTASPLAAGAATDLCVELPSQHSPRGRVAADDLLLGELRKRWVGQAGEEDTPTAHWDIAAAPARCHAEGKSVTVSLAVIGTRTNGWTTARYENVCGLSLGNDDESFLLCADAAGTATRVDVHARSDRGLMLAVGRLLRSLEISAAGEVTVPHDLALTVEAPSFGRMRGHQLTDWGFYMTTPFFEEYAKELLVFGTNQVEFAHIDYTRGDQYKLVAWSAILDKYDLRVSVFNVPFSTEVRKRLFCAISC